MTDDCDLLDEVMFSRLAGNELAEMELQQYRAWLEGVSPPSDRQIEDFADYVASARSWYKHLPMDPPGEKFVFYIDPHAGTDRVINASGKVFIRPRTEETEPFHYAWMTTAEYRRRFGHLAFACGQGSALFTDEFLNGEPVLVDRNSLRPELQLSCDTTMQPPHEVIEAGSCRLTALVHPNIETSFVQRWFDTNNLKANEFIGIGSWLVQQIQKERASLRQDMIDAMRRMRHVAFPAFGQSG